MSLYKSFEKKWFSFVDAISEKGIPLDKIVNALEDAGIPSLPAFGGIAIVAVALLVFMLLPGGGAGFAITVSGPAGPLSGASVSATLASGEELSATTSAGGLATLLLPIGQLITVTATAQGCDASTQDVDTTKQASLDVTLKCGGPAFAACIEQAKTFTAASLVSESGKAVSGCDVFVKDADGKPVDVGWKVKGNKLQATYSEASCPREGYEVEVSCKDDYSYYGSADDAIKQMDEDGKLVLSPPAEATDDFTALAAAPKRASSVYDINVYVTDEAGTPLEGVSVTAVDALGNDLSSDYENVALSATTSLSGVATLTLASGTLFYARASDPKGEYGPTMSESEATALSNSKITLRMPTGFTTKVTATSAVDNSPLGGVQVTFKESGAIAGVYYTDTDGTLTATLADKTYTAEFYLAGYAPEAISVKGGSLGNAVQLILLDDSNSGFLQVKVINAGGINEPIPGIQVRLDSSKGISLPTCTTGADGVCQYGRVLADTYKTFYFGETDYVAGPDATVEAGKNAEAVISITLPKRKVDILTSIQVGDRAPERMAGVAVTIYDVTYSKLYPDTLFDGVSDQATRKVPTQEIDHGKEIYIRASYMGADGRAFGPVILGPMVVDKDYTAANAIDLVLGPLERSVDFKIVGDGVTEQAAEAAPCEEGDESCTASQAAAPSGYTVSMGSTPTAEITLGLPYFDEQKLEKFAAIELDVWTGDEGTIDDSSATPIAIRPLKIRDYTTELVNTISLVTADEFNYGQTPAAESTGSSKYFAFIIGDYSEPHTYVVRIPLVVRQLDEGMETSVHYRAKWVTQDGTEYTTGKGWTNVPVTIAKGEKNKFRLLVDDPNFYSYSMWLSTDEAGAQVPAAGEPFKVLQGGTFYLQVAANSKATTTSYPVGIWVRPTEDKPDAKVVSFTGEILSGAKKTRIKEAKADGSTELNPPVDAPAYATQYALGTDDTLLLHVKMKAQLSKESDDYYEEEATVKVLNDEGADGVKFIVVDSPQSTQTPISGIVQETYAASRFCSDKGECGGYIYPHASEIIPSYQTNADETASGRDFAALMRFTNNGKEDKTFTIKARDTNAEPFALFQTPVTTAPIVFTDISVDAENTVTLTGSFPAGAPTSAGFLVEYTDAATKATVAVFGDKTDADLLSWGGNGFTLKIPLADIDLGDGANGFTATVFAEINGVMFRSVAGEFDVEKAAESAPETSPATGAATFSTVTSGTGVSVTVDSDSGIGADIGSTWNIDTGDSGLATQPGTSVVPGINDYDNDGILNENMDLNNNGVADLLEKNADGIPYYKVDVKGGTVAYKRSYPNAIPDFLQADDDGDGIPNVVDQDRDKNGIPDTDMDNDNDGYANWIEAIAGSNPNDATKTPYGLPNIGTAAGATAGGSSSQDEDHDGLANENTKLCDYSITVPDSTMAQKPDWDNDGLWDGYEVAIGTNPCDKDTDGDAGSGALAANTPHTDGMEVMGYYYDPAKGAVGFAAQPTYTPPENTNPLDQTDFKGAKAALNLYASASTVKQDQTFTVSVKLDHNYKAGVTNVEALLDLDANAIQYVSSVSTMTVIVAADASGKNKLTVTPPATAPIAPTNGELQLVTLTFHVDKDAKVGNYEIKLSSPSLTAAGKGKNPYIIPAKATADVAVKQAPIAIAESDKAFMKVVDSSGGTTKKTAPGRSLTLDLVFDHNVAEGLMGYFGTIKFDSTAMDVSVSGAGIGVTKCTDQNYISVKALAAVTSTGAAKIGTITVNVHGDAQAKDYSITPIDGPAADATCAPQKKLEAVRGDGTMFAITPQAFTAKVSNEDTVSDISIVDAAANNAAAIGKGSKMTLFVKLDHNYKAGVSALSGAIKYDSDALTVEASVEGGTATKCSTPGYIQFDASYETPLAAGAKDVIQLEVRPRYSAQAGDKHKITLVDAPAQDGNCGAKSLNTVAGGANVKPAPSDFEVTVAKAPEAADRTAYGYGVLYSDLAASGNVPQLLNVALKGEADAPANKYASQQVTVPAGVTVAVLFAGRGSNPMLVKSASTMNMLIWEGATEANTPYMTFKHGLTDWNVKVKALNGDKEQGFPTQDSTQVNLVLERTTPGTPPNAEALGIKENGGYYITSPDMKERDTFYGSGKAVRGKTVKFPLDLFAATPVFKRKFTQADPLQLGVLNIKAYNPRAGPVDFDTYVGGVEFVPADSSYSYDYESYKDVKPNAGYAEYKIKLVNHLKEAVALGVPKFTDEWTDTFGASAVITSVKNALGNKHTTTAEIPVDGTAEMLVSFSPTAKCAGEGETWLSIPLNGQDTKIHWKMKCPGATPPKEVQIAKATAQRESKAVDKVTEGSCAFKEDGDGIMELTDTLYLCDAEQFTSAMLASAKATALEGVHRFALGNEAIDAAGMERIRLDIKGEYDMYGEWLVCEKGKGTCGSLPAKELIIPAGQKFSCGVWDVTMKRNDNNDIEATVSEAKARGGPDPNAPMLSIGDLYCLDTSYGFFIGTLNADALGRENGKGNFYVLEGTTTSGKLLETLKSAISKGSTDVPKEAILGYSAAFETTNADEAKYHLYYEEYTSLTATGMTNAAQSCTSSMWSNVKGVEYYDVEKVGDKYNIYLGVVAASKDDYDRLREKLVSGFVSFGTKGTAMSVPWARVTSASPGGRSVGSSNYMMCYA